MLIISFLATAGLLVVNLSLSHIQTESLKC